MSGLRTCFVMKFYWESIHIQAVLSIYFNLLSPFNFCVICCSHCLEFVGHGQGRFVRLLTHWPSHRQRNLVTLSYHTNTYCMPIMKQHTCEHYEPVPRNKVEYIFVVQLKINNTVVTVYAFSCSRGELWCSARPWVVTKRTRRRLAGHQCHDPRPSVWRTRLSSALSAPRLHTSAPLSDRNE